MKLDGTIIRFGKITFQKALDRNIPEDRVVHCHNAIWNYVTRTCTSSKTMKIKVKKYLKAYLDYDFDANPDDTFINYWFTRILHIYQYNPSVRSVRGNEFKQQYLEDKGIGSLSGFIERVVEIHGHNLINYPEEKPTLELAYREIIIEILQENSL